MDNDEDSSLSILHYPLKLDFIVEDQYYPCLIIQAGNSFK